jgi:hypothetical protein
LEPGSLLASLGADPEDGEILRAAVGLVDVMTRPPDDAAIMAAVEAAFRA